jgi:hypothetical protein
MESYFYSSATGKTYSVAQMAGLFGINVETTDISILNLNGFYPVVASSPNFDTKLYNASSTWVLVPITPSGQGAQLDFSPVAKPLPEAIANGSTELKQSSNGELDLLLCDCGINNDVVTAVSSQDLIDRPARFQDVLDAMVAITDVLDSDLTAVESATTVDEINNIVNPPNGILFTGRGSGLGPEDLNVSYYVEFNSISMTESETELYVPSTTTVIPYGSGGPNAFDSMGNAFDPGGPYVIQIRETATSRVIAEFEVPLNPAGENVAF